MDPGELPGELTESGVLRFSLAILGLAAAAAVLSLLAAPRYQVLSADGVRLDGGEDAQIVLPPLSDVPGGTDYLAHNRSQIGLPGAVVSTRVFAGPDEFPPAAFRAYGILAFPDRPASAADTERMTMICTAFLNAVPHATEVQSGRDLQVVTVWPTEDTVSALRANRVARPVTCPVAVENYGLATAQRMILAAERAGQPIPADRGPFLLAWSPGADAGQPGVPVLFADLSNAVTPRAAKDAFGRWVREIQKSPEIWGQVPTVDRIRIFFREPADRYGEIALAAFDAVYKRMTAGGGDDS